MTVKHQKIRQAFEKNGYHVSYFNTSQEAADYLVEQINDKTVGFGDSDTLSHMDLAARLSQKNTVYDPTNCLGLEFDQVAQKALTTDVFLTSVNAASESGELVNIDGTGNRIAGSLFGHSRIFFVLGTNKIEPTLEKAIWRARNIAAPQNAKRLGYNTPCAIKADRCYDCSSPDRICNSLNIYFKKMHSCQSDIILIDQSLGL